MIHALMLLMLLGQGEPKSFIGGTGCGDKTFYHYHEVDEPAVTEVKQECRSVKSVFVCPTGSLGGACPCGYAYQPTEEFTCADKTRILLTAEDGSKHCVKF